MDIGIPTNVISMKWAAGLMVRRLISAELDSKGSTSQKIAGSIPASLILFYFVQFNTFFTLPEISAPPSLQNEVKQLNNNLVYMSHDWLFLFYNCAKCLIYNIYSY